MSPIQEQQIIALYIEARIKQEAAREAADALDLALFRAGNPKFQLKLEILETKAEAESDPLPPPPPPPPPPPEP